MTHSQALRCTGERVVIITYTRQRRAGRLIDTINGDLARVLLDGDSDPVVVELSAIKLE